MMKVSTIKRPKGPRPVKASRPLHMPIELMGFNILRLAHLKRNRDDALFKAQIGIGLTQLGLLLLLNESPGVGAGQLARVLLITPQSIAPALSELHTLGLVKKDRKRQRGARIEVHITQKGRGLLVRGRRVLAQTEVEARLRLSPRQATAFNESLVRIAESYAELAKAAPVLRTAKVST